MIQEQTQIFPHDKCEKNLSIDNEYNNEASDHLSPIEKRSSLPKKGSDEESKTKFGGKDVHGGRSMLMGVEDGFANGMKSLSGILGIRNAPML